MATKEVGDQLFEVSDELIERFGAVSEGMDGDLTVEKQLRLLAVCEDDVDRLALVTYCMAWYGKQLPQVPAVRDAIWNKKALQSVVVRVNLARKPLANRR